MLLGSNLFLFLFRAGGLRRRLPLQSLAFNQTLPSNGGDTPGHGPVSSYVSRSGRSEIPHQLVVGRRDDFHIVKPRPPEDRIIRRLHVNHVTP